MISGWSNNSLSAPKTKVHSAVPRQITQTKKLSQKQKQKSKRYHNWWNLTNTSPLMGPAHSLLVHTVDSILDIIRHLKKEVDLCKHRYVSHLVSHAMFCFRKLKCQSTGRSFCFGIYIHFLKMVVISLLKISFGYTAHPAHQPILVNQGWCNVPTRRNHVIRGKTLKMTSNILASTLIYPNEIVCSINVCSFQSRRGWKESHHVVSTDHGVT